VSVPELRTPARARYTSSMRPTRAGSASELALPEPELPELSLLELARPMDTSMTGGDKAAPGGNRACSDSQCSAAAPRVLRPGPDPGRTVHAPTTMLYRPTLPLVARNKISRELRVPQRYRTSMTTSPRYRTVISTTTSPPVIVRLRRVSSVIVRHQLRRSLRPLLSSNDEGRHLLTSTRDRARVRASSVTLLRRRGG